jgi:hypothetical protein
VLVARRMSPGARSAAVGAGAGWVDETGAAEIVASLSELKFLRADAARGRGSARHPAYASVR